jgi:outer membrane protein assembly factor BamE
MTSPSLPDSRVPAAPCACAPCAAAPPERTPRTAPRWAVGAGLALIAVAVAGCQSMFEKSSSGLFHPYRIDVPQGNYVDESSFELLKPGMTPEQVRFALGTPLLADPFHPDRWDYVFRYQFANGVAVLRRTSVYFKDGKVERTVSDPLPGRDAADDPALPGYRRATGRATSK